jgi:hypothetical protein
MWLRFGLIRHLGNDDEGRFVRMEDCGIDKLELLKAVEMCSTNRSWLSGSGATEASNGSTLWSQRNNCSSDRRHPNSTRRCLVGVSQSHYNSSGDSHLCSRGRQIWQDTTR